MMFHVVNNVLGFLSPEFMKSGITIPVIVVEFFLLMSLVMLDAMISVLLSLLFRLSLILSIRTFFSSSE